MPHYLEGFDSKLNVVVMFCLHTCTVNLNQNGIKNDAPVMKAASPIKIVLTISWVWIPFILTVVLFDQAKGIDKNE